MGETLKWSHILMIGSLLIEVGGNRFINRDTMISHGLRQCVPLGDLKDM